MGIFGRYRRGQIRGIDFSLAMIIFLLTMAQVVTLTGTFIDNAQNSQGVNSDLGVTQSYGRELLNIPGYENDGTSSLTWAATPTSNLGNNWGFGLSDGNGSVDPFKLGRISNNSDPDYLLTYSDISAATTLDRDFEIRLKSSIDIKIQSVTDTGTSYTVIGLVTLYGAPIRNATVNLFVNDGSNTATANQLTNSNGLFNMQIQDIANDASIDLVLAIASYAGGHYDMDYTYSEDGTPSSVAGVTVTNEDTSDGYGIQVESDISTPTYTAFYTNNAVSNVSVGAGTIIQVPQDGFVVILARNGASLGLTTFPIIIDDYLNSPLVPADPDGNESTTIELMINVRSVVMRFVFTTWS